MKQSAQSFFVPHDDMEHLVVASDIPGFGHFAVQMTELIGKNVHDPELREWVMPAFSTTTDEDRAVGAVLFMGAMKRYFTYEFMFTCGIPSVTLLGEVEDWEKILKRLDKIDVLGDEPRQFAAMLRPIVRHLILTFENPASEQIKHFWNTIVHKHDMASGGDYLTGWLTAFCFWNDHGSATEPDASNTQLGGIAYPTVGVGNAPAGLASVPVLINNVGHEFSATMLAGSFGISAGETAGSSSDSTNARSMLTTIQPLSGWLMYEDEAAEALKVREAVERRSQEKMNQLTGGTLDSATTSELFNTESGLGGQEALAK